MALYVAAHKGPRTKSVTQNRVKYIALENINTDFQPLVQHPVP